MLPTYWMVFASLRLESYPTEGQMYARIDTLAKQCLDTNAWQGINIVYSLIPMKCQGGNKYALSITVKFDQSTRRFGRISFARLLKLTKHIAFLLYLL